MIIVKGIVLRLLGSWQVGRNKSLRNWSWLLKAILEFLYRCISLVIVEIRIWVSAQTIFDTILMVTMMLLRCGIVNIRKAEVSIVVITETSHPTSRWRTDGFSHPILQEISCRLFLVLLCSCFVNRAYWIAMKLFSCLLLLIGRDSFIIHIWSWRLRNAWPDTSLLGAYLVLVWLHLLTFLHTAPFWVLFYSHWIFATRSLVSWMSRMVNGRWV